jgi:hypothetical protein
MPVFDRFAPARKERLPGCYLIPARLSDIVQLLRRQGIVVERITSQLQTSVQSFAVESLAVDSLFEGHRSVRLQGRWQPETTDSSISPGWFLVRTDQPLGTLGGYLLEPASEDGVVTWNLLDRELAPGTPYPILRATPAPSVRTIMLP